MRFFRSFPEVDYRFGENISNSRFTNLSSYADIIDQVKDNMTIYQFYNVQDGERPDIISHRLYGNETYGWTFWLLNDRIREQGWPLSYQDLLEYIQTILPGVCLNIIGTATHSETGITVHSMTEQFPVNTNVRGLLSGATGTVYQRNVNLGQLFVLKTNDMDFQNGEVIVDSLSSPTYSLTINTWSPAYKAAHHYLDSEGELVDIDPTTGTTPAGYTEVTHEDFLTEQNEELSRIKVIKPSLISRFVSLYKETISR